MTGEFAFIQRIRERVQQSRVPAPELSLGIGDDAAVFRPRPGRELLITTDLLVEAVDFKLAYAVPRWLGHKALAVSLSDIAAMGGTPRYAMLTLAIPQSVIRNPQSDKFWEEFFDGYCTLAESCGVVLIGGDLSATPHGLAIDSCVLGDCAVGQALRRSGARVGDGVYVTGRLGAAAAGLQLLLGGARAIETGWDRLQPVLPVTRVGQTKVCPTDEAQTAIQAAIRAHLRPAARVEFGRQLGEHGLVHALIDVSDGLAQDLAHLCEASQVSAVLERAAVPIAAELGLLATDAGTAFQLAVSGGEDYELLFTADANDEAELQRLAQACALPLARIGEIVAPDDAAAKIMLRTADKIEPLAARGYDHFAAG